MLYPQLISFRDADFTATVTYSEEEACKLIEAGLDFVWITTETKSFENANSANHQMTGVCLKHVQVDWGGFEPPTS
jgi:hypothetical protein